jgi:hypothetical protein
LQRRRTNLKRCQSVLAGTFPIIRRTPELPTTGLLTRNKFGLPVIRQIINYCGERSSVRCARLDAREYSWQSMQHHTTETPSLRTSSDRLTPYQRAAMRSGSRRQMRLLSRGRDPSASAAASGSVRQQHAGLSCAEGHADADLLSLPRDRIRDDAVDAE